MPNGVRIVPTETDDVVIFLAEDKSVIVKQEGEDPNIFILANTAGALTALQVETGGDTPRRIDQLEGGRGKIEVSDRSDSPLLLIFDDDGDGLPDRKLDDTGIYELSSIEWKKVVKGETTTQPNPTQD